MRITSSLFTSPFCLAQTTKKSSQTDTGFRQDKEYDQADHETLTNVTTGFTPRPATHFQRDPSHLIAFRSRLSTVETRWTDEEEKSRENGTNAVPRVDLRHCPSPVACQARGQCAVTGWWKKRLQPIHNIRSSRPAPCGEGSVLEGEDHPRLSCLLHPFNRGDSTKILCCHSRRSNRRITPTLLRSPSLALV